MGKGALKGLPAALAAAVLLASPAAYAVGEEGTGAGAPAAPQIGGSGAPGSGPSDGSGQSAPEQRSSDSEKVWKKEKGKEYRERKAGEKAGSPDTASGMNPGAEEGQTQPDQPDANRPGENGKSGLRGLDRAIQVIERNIEKNSNKPGRSAEVLKKVHEKLMELKNRQGDQSDEETDREVESALSQAAAAGEADEEVLKALAEVRKKLNETAGAVQALEEALKQNPADQSVLPQLRELYDALGKKEIQVFVNGLRPNFDVPPVIENGRTLVPIRRVAEALGATVDWKDGTVMIRKGGKTVVLRIGDPSAEVDGRQVSLDVPAKLSGGRTLVPLRFVGEAFGMAVDYRDGIVSVHPPASQNG